MARWRRFRNRDPQDFNHLVEVYERRDQLTSGWVTDWLEAQLKGRSGSSAIDLGCGVGRSALMLAEHFEYVRAIDVSSEMIRYAQEHHAHPRVEYHQSDLEEVRGRYDLVLSVMVLHHVGDIARALHHVAELVMPGGTAILVDNAEEPKNRWQLHLGHLASLYGELRARQPQAWQRFRVRSDRGWLAHRLSDRYLRIEEFDSIYGQALPGAVIAPVRGLRTVVWTQPEQPSLLASNGRARRPTNRQTPADGAEESP